MDVTAWQYDRKAPVPLWVARRFHNLGDGRLTTVAPGGETVHVHEGDWVVTDGSMAVVLTDAEFTRIFQKISERRPTIEGEEVGNAT